MPSPLPAALTVSVPLSPSYQNNYASIAPTSVSLALPLLDGTHTVTSEPVQVGALNNFGRPPIMASCSVWYSFDTAAQRLTLCSSELASEKSSYITTYVDGVSVPHRQFAQAAATAASQGHLLWQPDTPLTPGLAQELQALVKQLDDALFQQAVSQQLLVVQLAPLPQLPAALYKQLCPVYRNGQFVEFYDETKEYDESYTVGNFQSIYNGTATFPSSQHYANVIGSTRDDRHGEASWIELWRTAYNVPNPTGCSSLNFSGKPGGGVITPAFNCRGRLVGGHVVLGDNAERVAKGSNDVYIIPICAAHNGTDSVYMMPVHDGRAVSLKNYFQLSAPDFLP